MAQHTGDEEGLNKDKVLLVTAGAGGVGSIVIQIAKHVLKIGKVIATASRPGTTLIPLLGHSTSHP